MGIKLLWTGLTWMYAVPLVWHEPHALKVGAILMVIGCVRMWLDK